MSCRSCAIVDRQLAPLARRFLIHVVPRAAAELRALRRLAERIPDIEFRREALSSIEHKDFHVHGGSILATFLPKEQVSRYVALVAAFETAVDYLDNLCDRVGAFDEDDFRALHEALMDAVTPGASPRAYFRHRDRDDGGYLAGLVVRSQEGFASLAGCEAIEPYVREVTHSYCELQALKHLAPGIREERCAQAFSGVAPDLNWWEGAAACGSTMPTFALAFGAMHAVDANGALALKQTYFPYISAFHILLDYFIDQAEDRSHGELNFVTCYPNRAAARDGIARIGRAALDRARATEHPREHAFAVRAMCAFYCSRASVAEQSLDDDAAVIAQAVDVDLDAAAWLPGGSSVLGPLLALYRRVIKV